MMALGAASIRHLSNILVVALLVASQAHAYRGRPIAGARFGDRSNCTIDGMASDGTSGLVICREWQDSKNVYGQIVTPGAPPLPMFFITSRGFPSGAVTWTGSSYLFATTDDHGAILVWRISRGGVVLEKRQLRPAGFYGVEFVTNGGRALLLTRERAGKAMTGFLLDERGELAGPPLSLGDGPRVHPLGNGFAVLRFEAKRTAITRVDSRGALLGTSYLDEVPWGSGLSTASSGTHLLLLSADPREGTIRTAVIAPDGTLERPPMPVVAFPPEPYGFWNPKIAWTGQDFLATLLTGDGETAQSYAFRVNTAGELVSGPAPIGTPGAFVWPFETIGGQTLTSVFFPAGSPHRPFLATIPRGSLALEGPSFEVGRRINKHDGYAIAASRGEYLAAWIEHDEQTATVRASRIDRSGAYLDGEGIALGQTYIRGRYDAPHAISIASDGTGWLVVWSDGAVHGARITRGGQVRDGAPLEFGSGTGVALQWGRGAYVLTTIDARNWVVCTVDRSGIAGPRHVLATGKQGRYGETTLTYSDPRLAFDGTRFLAIASENYTTCSTVQPVCGTASYVSAARVDPNGAPIDVATNQWISGSSATVSGGNGGYLLLFTQFHDSAHHVMAMHLDGSVPPALSPRIRLSPGSRATAAFDGTAFIAAWRASDTETLEVARLTEAGVIDGPRAMPLDDEEAIFFPALTADADTPPILAYTSAHPATGAVSRIATVFPGEIDRAVNVAPPAPSGVVAERIGAGRIRVRWSPVPNALGVDVELVLPNGTHRAIATAPGTATELDVPMEYRADAVRLRAWNRDGPSAPSAEAWISATRARTIRK
jgi:hypothetical protein